MVYYFLLYKYKMFNSRTVQGSGIWLHPPPPPPPPRLGFCGITIFECRLMCSTSESRPDPANYLIAEAYV